jgi:hypothetical protein
MKKTNLKYLLGAFLVFLAATSCEDQLDVNENPNAPTAADVQLVLPQAIVATANIANQFNSYGAHFGGYMANAGGFSGFGNLLSYNLTPNDWNGLWVNTYHDPLKDLKYVIDKTEGDAQLAYFNAAAKILTVYNYQKLVDAFGDIPYSEALRAEEGIVAPAYDDAATIYQDLFAKLDEAITTIETGLASTTVLPLALTKATDPLFGAIGSGERDAADQAEDWVRFANTLKLRILIRLSEKSEFASFVSTGFANLDQNFIVDDAIVDPGYELNRPNPAWNSWGRQPSLTLSNSSRIPTTFAFGFYNGAKITDEDRGEVSFVNYPTTPTNQLGNEDGAPPVVANTVTWAANETGYTGRGILKGAAMGQPLMLVAERYFLESEAILFGHLPGGDSMAESRFNDGIQGSFAYLWKDQNETLAALDTAGLFSAYLAANPSNRLVQWDQNAGNEQKQEAIITQKYIAVNMINSDEGYNEYRRTGYPATVPNSPNPALDIASNKSTISNRTDRLPTRILYPSTEQSYNAANYVNIDFTSDLIFWDPN